MKIFRLHKGYYFGLTVDSNPLNGYKTALNIVVLGVGVSIPLPNFKKECSVVGVVVSEDVVAICLGQKEYSKYF